MECMDCEIVPIKFSILEQLEKEILKEIV